MNTFEIKYKIKAVFFTLNLIIAATQSGGNAYCVTIRVFYLFIYLNLTSGYWSLITLRRQHNMQQILTLPFLFSFQPENANLPPSSIAVFRGMVRDVTTTNMLHDLPTKVYFMSLSIICHMTVIWLTAKSHGWN